MSRGEPWHHLLAKDEKLRIFVVVGNDIEAKSILDAVRASNLAAEIHRVPETPAQLAHALENRTPDVVLFADSIDGFPFPVACAIVEHVRPRTPLIVFARAETTTDLARYIEQGASDCIHVDRTFLLGAAIKRSVVLRHGLDDAAKAKAALAAIGPRRPVCSVRR